LASDRPGEVNATVAAIIRNLGSCGLDLHDLADRLTSGNRERRGLTKARELTKAELEQAQREAFNAGYKAGRRYKNTTKWHQMGNFCLSHGDRMS